MHPKFVKTFLAVLHHRSFTRAAGDVNLAQSTVSDQIQTLEAELDTPLFLREKAALEPTPAALALRPYAEELLRLSEDARAAVADLANETGRTITIGCLETIAAWKLAPWLPSLRRLYPNLQVNLKVAGSGELRRLLEQGQIDVAIGFFVRSEQGAFMSRMLAAAPLALIRGYSERKGPSSDSISALASEAFVVTGAGCTYRRMFDEVFRERGLTAPTPVAEVGSVGAIVRVVAAGGTLGVVPRLAAEAAIRRGEIQELAWPGDAEPTVPLTMLWRRRRVMSQGLKHFLDAVTLHFVSLRSSGDRLPHEERILS